MQLESNLLTFKMIYSKCLGYYAISKNVLSIFSSITFNLIRASYIFFAGSSLYSEWTTVSRYEVIFSAFFENVSERSALYLRIGVHYIIKVVKAYFQLKGLFLTIQVPLIMEIAKKYL